VSDTRREFSRIREAVATWSLIRQLLRSGEEGQLVPVVIPKDRRRARWLFPLAISFYLLGVAIFSGGIVGGLALFLALLMLIIAGISFFLGAIVEIEQGTTGILSRWGQIVGVIPPGRHYLWWPWEKVEAVVDTSTEIPYTAPVMGSANP
jgi:hypothetical protein